MKSIQERAWEYAVSFRQGDSVFAEGFIQGAFSQNAVDIQKACEWLLSQNLISRCIVDDTAFVKRFRKAMEE